MQTNFLTISIIVTHWFVMLSIRLLEQVLFQQVIDEPNTLMDGVVVHHIILVPPNCVKINWNKGNLFSKAIINWVISHKNCQAHTVFQLFHWSHVSAIYVCHEGINDTEYFGSWKYIVMQYTHIWWKNNTFIFKIYLLSESVPASQ